MTKKKGPAGKSEAKTSHKTLNYNKNLTEMVSKSKTNSAFLDAALLYADRGWPVFPINPRSKAPLKNSHGFKDASRDPKQITKWWRKQPHRNVGIATGHEADNLVVDVDPRNGGDESLKLFEKEYEALPQTPRVKTGGNGIHFFFKHPGGQVPCRANILPGIDIKCDGGYVLAPPSIHPNGETYLWEVNPDEVPLADLPNHLRQIICADPQNDVAPAHLIESSISLEDLNVPKDTKRLISEGDLDGKYLSRSEAIFAALRSLVKAGHDDAAIKAVILDPSNALSNKPIEKGAAWLCGEIKRARAKTDNKPDPQFPSPKPFTAEELIAENFSPLVEIIPGIIVSGLTILAGPPKIGKSWLAMTLGIILPRGGMALGAIPHRRHAAADLLVRRSRRTLAAVQPSAGRRDGCDGHGYGRGSVLVFLALERALVPA